MNKHYNCRICNTTLGDCVFELKNIPLGVQYFPKNTEVDNQEPVDVQLFECSDCGLIQAHSNQVVYEAENSAATSVSALMMQHKLSQAVDFITKYNLENKSILEAGCGDGHFLKLLQSANAGLVVGVEPSVKSKDTSIYKHDIKIYSNYITEDFKIEEGPFDAFATFHVMEHIPDLHDFVRGLSVNLKNDGIGLVEVPSSEVIFEDYRFYDIINDHLNYFTLNTLALIFEMHNFEILEKYRDWNDEHNVLIVKKRSNIDFVKLEDFKFSSISSLKNTLEKYHSVAIWGASMHALTILSQFKTDKISCVIDSAEYKQGRVTPVSHYQIISPSHIKDQGLQAIVVIAPRFQNEIVQLLMNSGDFKGSIYVLEKNQIEKIR